MSKNNDLRRKLIEDLLKEENIMQVSEFSKLLQVSAETIRKDLAYLEEKGVVYRTHGGARLRSSNIDIPYDIRSQEYTMEKRQIARQVPNFIHDDDIIYVDACSTASYLGPALKGKKNLTIVTNSMELLTSLQESPHKIIVTGGIYMKDGKRTSGDFALSVIDSIFFDICILGMDGCLHTDGPANMSGDEIVMNQHILSRSKSSILLSDASKFDKISHFQYAKFSQFDVLITTKLKPYDRERVGIANIIETQ